MNLTQSAVACEGTAVQGPALSTREHESSVVRTHTRDGIVARVEPVPCVSVCVCVCVCV